MRPSDKLHANDLPHELLSILGSALQVGGVAGRNLCIIHRPDSVFEVSLDGSFVLRCHNF